MSNHQEQQLGLEKFPTEAREWLNQAQHPKPISENEQLMATESHTAMLRWKERAEAAESKLSALEADAQRYRWLRDKAQFGSDRAPAVANGTCEHLTIFVGEELDREIDAALSVGQISNIDKRKLSMEEEAGAD